MALLDPLSFPDIVIYPKIKRISLSTCEYPQKITSEMMYPIFSE